MLLICYIFGPYVIPNHFEVHNRWEPIQLSRDSENSFEEALQLPPPLSQIFLPPMLNIMLHEMCICFGLLVVGDCSWLFDFTKNVDIKRNSSPV